MSLELSAGLPIPSLHALSIPFLPAHRKPSFSGKEKKMQEGLTSSFETLDLTGLEVFSIIVLTRL